MNRKGFSLIELLGCLVLLAIIMCIGLYSARGTLATTLSTLNDVSTGEISDAAINYVLENSTTWINSNDEEYTCLTVDELVDGGYFKDEDVKSYKDKQIKVIRDSKIKTINSSRLVDECN